MILSRCEQNPVITSLPGSQVEFRETHHSLIDTTFTRTPTRGSSFTLYAGPIDGYGEKSSILIKFANVDSSQLAGFQSAELVLFRRTFGTGIDTLPDPSLEFSLSIVESQDNDTIWTESDTAGQVTAESLDLSGRKTAHLRTDSVAVPTGNTAADIRDDLEYLAFSVDSVTLSGWRTGEVANNGFLIQQENPTKLIGFHSRDGDELTPYLALTFSDTTSTGAEDTTTYYYRPSGDLSIYSSYSESPVYSDSLLHLDHSNGIRGHIELDAGFCIDTTSVVIGARLVLYANLSESSVMADQVDIRVLRRAQSLGDGDSTAVYITKKTYTKESGSLSLNIYYYLMDLAHGNYDNYGLDLVVLPYNHDFDHLTFWGSGSSAEDSLKPRLEVDYGDFYKENTW